LVAILYRTVHSSHLFTLIVLNVVHSAEAE
jgi:hypothetical protein